MSLSVVIATCNRPDRLARALEALRPAVATSGERHPVIVADNGTHRSAREAVEQFARGADFPVRHVATPPFNKAAALNAGIAAAETDWLAFTDDDCLPDANWLKAGAAYAASSGVNLFSGRLEPGPITFPLPRWLRHRPHEIVTWSPAYVDYAPLPQSGILAPNERVPFGANIFVRKWVFDTYGGYDEALWARCGEAALGSEDAEFGMRVRVRGERIGYCAEALVVHPIFPERTTMRYYLRHIYHAGLREPMFTEPGREASLPYLGKTMLTALLKSAGWCLRGDAAHAMHELMNATRDWGEITGWRRLGRAKPGC
ncbi:MAG: glycosyltransferase [Lentisphaerae bacterium]|nr:glycosyltransferase [Lentisphaerota bacterium]